MSVRHLLILLTIPLISGCSLFNLGSVEPVTINKKAVERTRLDLTEPKVLQLKIPQWFIITPENSDEVWKKLKEEGTDLVLFALTDDGYEELAINIAELRSLIAQQRSIIIKYKEYYEPKKEGK